MKWIKSPPGWLLYILPLAILFWLPLSPRAQAADQALHLANLAENPAVAANQIEKAALLQPWRLDLWELAGQKAQTGGQMEQAITDLNRVKTAGKLSAAGALALGDAYRQSGSLDLAEQIYADLLAQKADPEVLRRLTEMAEARADYSTAGSLYQKWLSVQPDDPAVLYRAGLIECLTDPQSGLARLIQAEKLDPAYSDPVKTLQAALNNAGLQEDEAYQRLLAGRGYAAIGEWRLAGTLFQQAIDLRPDYAEAWALLGESRQQLGQPGVTELERARKLDPQSTFVQVLYAMYWMRAGKPDQAAQLLEQTVHQEPQNANWWMELANAYSQMGKINEALASYQEATRLEPQDSYPWRSLAAFCILYNQDPAGAGIAAARQAVLLDPQDPANLDVMAQVLMKTGDLTTAARFLQRALSLDANYAPADLHYGILYLQQGDPASAQGYLQAAVALDAGGPVASQAQKLLDNYGIQP